MRGFPIFLASALLMALPAAIADVDLAANGDGFDIEVSVHLDEALQGWAVWKRYHQGKEWVLARPVDAKGNTVGEVVDVAGGARVVDGVSLAGSADGKSVWVFWSSYVDAQWRVMGRHWNGTEGWAEVQAISDGEGHALKPRAVVADDGAVVAAWHELSGQGSSRIWNRVFEAGHWRGAKMLSEAEGKAFRAMPVNYDGRVWLVFDRASVAVTTLPVWPEDSGLGAFETWGPELTLPPGPVPGPRRIMHGEAVGSVSEGLCIPKLILEDVIAGEAGSGSGSDAKPSVLTALAGGQGVVDMLHEASVFQLQRSGATYQSKDLDGRIRLLSGLLPDLRSGKGYPSGYSGRRRHPIMVDGEGEGGGAWMIWERKSKPSGSGTKTAGQLLGRQIVDGVWGETQLLMDGLIDYRAALPAKVRDGKLWVVGAKVPHHWKRPSQLVAVDMAAAQPFEQEDWSDHFKPLSIEMEKPAIRTAALTRTDDGEKLYNLYWGDLHCHSGLTGDAEGEPDEILFYGRDRGGLDVMVMQDNDDVHGRPLTEGEYYMGVAHSQWATQEGSFVALPGYEWTQRTSDKGVPQPTISSFEQSFPNGYPNHRTIIYPHAGGPIVRYFEVEHDFRNMADQVAAAGGILNSQHPAFKITDHPAEANLEVTACWGIYIRSVPQRFHAELSKGRHVGFVGTSDSHRRNPGLCGGLTGIWAEELTSEAILDALRSHRCFATNGSRIVVDSRAQGRLSDEVVKAKEGSADLVLSLRGTKPITRVTLMGDGKKVQVWEGDGSAERYLEHKVEGLAPGRHRFYWEIEQEGQSKQYSGNISVARGHLAWSSPHFVDVE